MTPTQIETLIQNFLLEHGFLALGCVRKTDDIADGNQVVNMVWAPERATGMAALTQDQVTPKAYYFVVGGLVYLDRINIGVHYTHYQCGTNGKDYHYRVEDGKLVRR